jgi:hypothetical protein
MVSSDVAIPTNLVLPLCRMMERYHVQQELQCRAARGGLVRCVSVDLHWERQMLFYRCSRLLWHRSFCREIAKYLYEENAAILIGRLSVWRMNEVDDGGTWSGELKLAGDWPWKVASRQGSAVHQSIPTDAMSRRPARACRHIVLPCSSSAACPPAALGCPIE